MTYPEDDKEILAREEAREWQTRALKAEATVEWFEKRAQFVDEVMTTDTISYVAMALIKKWEAENPRPCRG